VTTAVIVQARMGSSRLPGKVMEKLGGRTVLEHVLTRCATIPGADLVVCAVPDEVASEPLERVAHACGAKTFRGSEADVLARYLGAARAHGADIVMRVTSDCPLIDPAICGAVLQLRRREAADYATNNMPPSFPHGLDCEAFTTDALAAAGAATTEPHDREHVTPWLRRAEHLKRCNLASDDPSLARHRWTLDYPEDLAFLRAVQEQAGKDSLIEMHKVLGIVEGRPELKKINENRSPGRTDWVRQLPLFRDRGPDEVLDAIVVLAGGIKQDHGQRWVSTDLTEDDDRQGAPGAILRIHAAAMLADIFPKAVIVASGGEGYDVPVNTLCRRPLLAEILHRELVENGVSPERIFLENKSNNTYQQLLELQTMLALKHWERAIVVTNSWHLTRVRAMLLRKFGDLARRADVMAAEDVLVAAQPDRWITWLAGVYQSDFLKKRIEREHRGVRQIKNDTYDFK
jgi:spore coat polysaccharide biosynthesis protein SpsF